jgi:hypothetical protein
MTHAPTLRRAIAASLTAAVATSAHAQLLNGYTGDEPGAKSWTIDVTTGEFEEGGAPASRAAAHDPARGWTFSVADARRSTDPVRLLIGGDNSPGPVPIFASSGRNIFIMSALAFGDGVLYGFARTSQVNSYGLGTIDIDTGTFTYLFTEAELGGFVTGLAYDHDRSQLLVGIQSSVYVLDPATGDTDFIATASHDGLAYGYDRIYMVCGSSNACPDISVYNRVTERFEPDIPLPERNGNGSSGSTFVEDRAASPPPPLYPERRVQIRSIDFDAGVVELHNFSGFDIDLTGWRFCSHDLEQAFNYTAPDGFAGRILRPGDSRFIHFNEDAPRGSGFADNASELGGSFATPLDQDAYALQLFFPDVDGDVSFGNPDRLADHVQWNIAGRGAGDAESRTAQAVQAGLWPAVGAFVATAGDSERIELLDLSGDEPGGPAEYAVTPTPGCSGDVDGDGDTDVFDFSVLTANFGAGPGAARGQGDVTGDGFVDVFDFTTLTADFGCDG